MDAFELLVQAHRPAMKTVLADLVEMLRANGVRYVIGGANALSLYVRPRMTVDIDAFVDAARKDDVDRILSGRFQLVDIARFHSKFRQGDVEIDILYAGADAEDFALASGRDAVILGTQVKAASPEALLWLYLVSEKGLNFHDGVALLRSQPNLDLALVRGAIERHNPAALPKLERMLTAAQEPERSYEASRTRRQ